MDYIQPLEKVSSSIEKTPLIWYFLTIQLGGGGCSSGICYCNIDGGKSSNIILYFNLLLLLPMHFLCSPAPSLSSKPGTHWCAVINVSV